MHWKNLGNYDYLGAYSLEGVAEQITVTVKNVKKERVTANGGKSEDCIVASFEETMVDNVVVKPMVLNSTNCKTIEKLYGGDIENWIGKRITIYATTTQFARETVSCLRIRNEIPKEEVYACSVCGKVISKDLYQKSTAKYGASICSAECLADYKKQKGE